MLCRNQALGAVLTAFGAGLVVSVLLSSGVLRVLLGAAVCAAGVLLGCRR